MKARFFASFAVLGGFLWFAVGLAGCHSPALSSSGGAPPSVSPSAVSGHDSFPRTLTDARGKTLTLANAPRRIVSLAPSETEVLFDLGAGPQVAADTTACDFPPEARNRPHIDAMRPSLESIEAQSPDLVVAVGSINVHEIEALDRAHVPVLVVDPQTVSQALDSIKLLGQATGQETRAQQIVTGMQARLDAVRKAVAGAATKPRVLILYDVNPVYTTGPGSFIDDLIQAAGGTNVADGVARGNVLSPENVLRLAPDVILCEPALQAKARQMPGWAEGVPAVRNNRFFWPSERATFVRPTARLAGGAEELARYLHPESGSLPQQQGRGARRTMLRQQATP